MKKTSHIFILFFILFYSGFSVHAQERTSECYSYVNAFVDIAQEKKQFEEKMNDLTQKPDVSTSKLTETGVEYMRLYHAKLVAICNKIITVNNTGCVKTQEEHQGDFQSCFAKIDSELAMQKTIFTQFMIGDAGQKRIQFIVNKYKEMNAKFMNLVDTIMFIKSGLRQFLLNIGKEATATQAPEE